ncbi:hypothetical protein BWI15_30670 [Kribbella sp. ALI-6-A]|uniref:hypothetical protein n=1 Tax=Kribbella sp. ALI-6-A TaxID=1933817 RepID=UPI00097C5DCF|nr:hypothetical protein [Kribbella sp. ALI-6-A]ONI67487.1 hypothetical protein BWI15_30670 [Kribbella sp. ALI-6-A]
MRRRLVVLLAAVMVAVAVPPVAAAAAEDECLYNQPSISQDRSPVETIVLKASVRVPIEMHLYRDSLDCAGMVAHVRKADGSNQQTVALTEQGGRGMPPSWTWYGWLPLTAATGGGDWVVTKVTHGANELQTNLPFHVYRGSELTLDQPARTSGTARTTLSGQLRRYSNTGALVAAPNTTVRLLHQTKDLLIATATTDAAGRFRTTVAFTQNTTLRASTAASGNYVAELTDYRTAHKLIAMSYLSALPTAYVNGWWKVSGSAYPGKLHADLQVFNGTAWVTTPSYGPIPANGVYSRYWMPTKAGTHRLRVWVRGERVDNSPSREVSVKVTALPKSPTYFVGSVVAPTAGLPIRRDSTMSTFGNLKYRRADGTLGPVGNQVVEVHVRPVGEAAWWMVGAARTSVSGYFYTRWGVPVQPGQSFQVMLTYPTKLPTTASSATGVFGPFSVQP